MISAAAPSDSRYFGTKRIHVSSPAPMSTIATSSRTRLRLRPKNSPRRGALELIWLAGEERDVLPRLVVRAELVQRGFEASSQLVCRPASPVVQEKYRRLCRGHVLVDRHHVQSVRA